ncbi:hypothetical protein TNCT_309891 [Trichonephila clavata]|uniref:Uncharacterized protein n=2 Tax=Trichonephila TaxID=2585208 RepID=A0A8X6FP84_TRICU|nr:hypothetical protein TNCT_309891 [Trichonephila clavata]GFY40948.1 hypothetical protein TNIN_365161 [Trichonephila inaurata madagascariensis]
MYVKNILSLYRKPVKEVRTYCSILIDYFEKWRGEKLCQAFLGCLSEYLNLYQLDIAPPFGCACFQIGPYFHVLAPNSTINRRTLKIKDRGDSVLPKNIFLLRPASQCMKNEVKRPEIAFSLEERVTLKLLGQHEFPIRGPIFHSKR